ncbi:crossover junction endodeoxyribonuclease RuvC [bacterium]|nr:MAG: crossover junction endodeoxyribonuclease RuvC [bacterium]
MRVIGIDPGSVICGYGVVDIEGNSFSLVEYGVIKAKIQSDDFNGRLKILNEAINKVIKRTSPDISAFETIFFAKNVQSLVKLSHARAVTLLSATQNELPIFEYSPNEIKKSVTGKGKASKEQVQFMVKKILKINETPEFYDSTDALAIAICHCLKLGNSNKKRVSNWSQFAKENPDRVK